MIKLSFLTALGVAISILTVKAADSAGLAPVYEMRVYYSPEGKLDALHARFRDHTMKLFERHGIKNVGYFVPEGDNPQHKLIYFLSYPSREARDKGWKAFMADPDWQKAAKESEKNGKIVAKVESYFLEPTDYSPKLEISNKGGRVFELRTYTTPEGKLGDLDARFRNHTMELFRKHRMENVVYWHRMKDQPAAKTTLVYLLAHKSREEGAKSFAEFREDPVWKKVKAESEKDGSLTVNDGVKNEILVPTDYSPLK